MPLTLLAKLFAEVDHTEPEVVVDEPTLLFAQKCESWWRTGDGERVTVLLVYRSTMVKDTKLIYRPVADLLLDHKNLDVLARGTIEDPEMVYGRGEYIVTRMTNADEWPEGVASLGEIRAIIDAAMSHVLGRDNTMHEVA